MKKLALLSLMFLFVGLLGTSAQEVELVNLDEEVQLTAGSTMNIAFEVEDPLQGPCVMKATFSLENGTKNIANYSVSVINGSVTINVPNYSSGSTGILCLTFLDKGEEAGEEKIQFQIK